MAGLEFQDDPVYRKVSERESISSFNILNLQKDQLMTGVLKFRPARQDDEPFLKALRAQFDSERLFIQFWGARDDAFKRNILDLQFRAHAAHYKDVKHNFETRDNIIELDDQPIGRFIVSGDRNEIRLADILIDSRYRGIGIGQAVIDTTKAECMQSKRPLRLHAEKFGQAVHFYLSHGFRKIEETDTHYLMEWRPSSMPDKPK
jgi:GNAT superfamily N-acetyltransferase